MKCIHGKEVIEFKALGMCIFRHNDDTSCSVMNSKTSFNKLSKEIDFSKKDDLRFEYAYLETEGFKEKLIELLQEPKRVKLIINMQKYKVHITMLYKKLLKVFGTVLTTNIDKLSLFDFNLYKEDQELKDMLNEGIEPSEYMLPL